MKVRSITEQLQTFFGGKWKYDGVWYDQESKEGRYISRVATDLHDENSPSQYILYNDGEPKIVFFGVDGITLI